MPHPAGVPTSRRAELILQELDSLPTLPSVAARLLKIGSAEDADLKEIIKLIAADPVLTAKVLSMSRRAELGLGSRVTTVERAVVLLGLEALQSVVLSVQVFDWARNKQGGAAKPPARGAGGEQSARFDRVGFWRHSIAVACCAELICATHKELGVRPCEGFVAGLLHDLGKLALEIILPQAYDRVIELSEHRQANIADVEQSIIGLDHHTAGKRLAARWELPGELADVMWLHGQYFPSLPAMRHRNLIGVVGVADAVCRELHLGWSGNHSGGQTLDEVCAPLQLKREKIEGLFPRLVEAVGERCRDLGLSDEPTEQVMLESLRSANRRLAKLNGAVERRAQAAQEQTVTLGAIASFASTVRPEMTALEVISQVVRSAASVLGPGLYATVYEGGPGDLWLAVRFDREGRRTASELAEAVRPDNPDVHAESLSEMVARSPEDAHRMARRILDEALPAAGARDTQLMALGPGAGHPDADGEGTEISGDGPVLLLLHDREGEVKGMGRRALGALMAAWGAAVAGAAYHEEASRLGEQLAESNRVLSQTQRELAEAQAMARLGELTAGAAHEMNNPLAIISGRCQMLANVTNDPAQRGAAQAVIEAARRLDDLVSRLHIIARPPTARMTKTNLAEIITEAIKRAREQASRKSGRPPAVPIRVSLSEKLLPARLDRELMIQALAEIVINAIESRPREYIDVRVQTDGPDDRLLIQVTDTGCGMSDHALEHAMDPFFSEKPAGRQPGLGLATAWRLISLHGGVIKLSSEKDVGTTATVTLPDWRWRESTAPIARAA